MGKYIKLFKQHSQYETYINSEDAILPNVSYCEDRPEEVHFNPFVESKVIATFNVSWIDPEYPTKILNNTDYVSSIEVDGITLPELVTNYPFETTGEHIVSVTLSDRTTFGDSFSSLQIIGIVLPDTITSIGDNAFADCNLTGITIPNSVTSIGDYAFDSCVGIKHLTIPESVVSIGAENPEWFYLDDVTFLATTPTNVDSYFLDCCSIIYVPSESVSVYKEEWKNYEDRIYPIIS